MEEPPPLPPYTFQASLTEDENFLTWATILARHSFSRKGHMGALIVRPPSASAEDSPPNQRVLSYANNTPLLYHRNPRNVAEIHAEALCVSLSARRGTSILGSTCYVTFPPCNECFRLLVASGVERIVFRKSLVPGINDSLLVSARALGIELKGTGFRFSRGPSSHSKGNVGGRMDEQGASEDEEQGEEEQLEMGQAEELKRGQRQDGGDGEDEEKSFLLSIQESRPEGWWSKLVARAVDQQRRPLSTSEMEEIEERVREEERRMEEERDRRVKRFWEDQGETSQVTRERVNQWWTRFQHRYRTAAKELRQLQLGGWGEREAKLGPAKRKHAEANGAGVERGKGRESRNPRDQSATTTTMVTRGVHQDGKGKGREEEEGTRSEGKRDTNGPGGETGSDVNMDDPQDGSRRIRTRSSTDAGDDGGQVMVTEVRSCPRSPRLDPTGVKRSSCKDGDVQASQPGTARTDHQDQDDQPSTKQPRLHVDTTTATP
ncbi:hypothetical protein IE53DRAFT_153693 [Violaceomyces palustris]|uniref:Uncharacterized protein n=1 Tax=Violaceomyces palustris TaxID=1673888 RepID=A0ACD0P640_9BASI|nr:hypothetical protein IE53DRAFT_153693 [Violaceomyces palustris]